MTEKRKIATDKGKTFTALLTDSAFDCLPQDLIIAKLNAYGFSLDSGLIHSYLSNKKQRLRINISHSSWEFAIYVKDVLFPCLC